MINNFNIFSEISIRWILQDFTDGMSMLVQVLP